MLKFSIVVAIAAVATPAFARDSAWLVCKGVGTHDKEKSYFVASLLEHRSASGSDRDLEVALIYGVHIAHGAIVAKPFESKAQAVKLATVDTKKTAFTGTALMSEDFKTFTLKGQLDFTFGDDPKAKTEAFDAKLTCEQLDDQAIGH
jgi:hypothetical protein